MTLFASKPTYVEAVQHTGDFVVLEEFAGMKVTIRPDDGSLLLLAGKDGAQDWVPVPLNHWLVRQPGDLSDIWPVDPDYFEARYEEATNGALAGAPERSDLAYHEAHYDGREDD